MWICMWISRCGFSDDNRYLCNKLNLNMYRFFCVVSEWHDILALTTNFSGTRFEVREQRITILLHTKISITFSSVYIILNISLFV